MRTQHVGLDDGPPGTAVFEKEPQAVTDARDLTRGFLAGLSPAVGDQAAASVELVVSELITNVVRHARGALCSLRLQARADAITVTVSDADPRAPQERTPDLAGGTGGFGWPMVRNLADAVSVTLGATGKTIRAELAR
ncbi:ATP-binding protein [Streptomyces sp. BG9H]|uniref:ATP-binding protein n=1 Tax=Streptomyces anatolicus TaxID=2675858 RepID=A0ABS6YIX2_9ACTN|nr:ATP-binding protein [Streptomyces anatolicus]MBW5421383.1 ATP-binding protein [Streptomyces anatolicus]